MNALWPDTFVEESNLAFTVSALRKALGDDQDGEQFIQTRPTRGYRFVAPVTPRRGSANLSTSETPPRSVKPLVRRAATIALAVGRHRHAARRRPTYGAKRGMPQPS